MAILDCLSAELVLCITSFLRQVDLLNLSLTCKRINGVTKPERFREYRNVKIGGRSFLPFIVKVLQNPELSRYVHRVDLKEWTTLEDFNLLGSPSTELSRVEYAMLTEAAKDAGVIADVLPYERKSYVVKQARTDICDDIGVMGAWYIYAFRRDVAFHDLSYDRKFCQMLRAGIEDPLIVLLMALLPNVHEILLHGVPGDMTVLPWRAKHNFTALRRMTARGVNGEVTWPIAFFNSVLATSKLETFEASCASSWYRGSDEIVPWKGNLSPLSLTPGSLNLKMLELRFCALKTSDLQILLEACPKLKTLRYISGDQHVGSSNPSPAKVIELLQPFQSTLEELWLNLDVERYENKNHKPADLILSMSHMTALKRLSTTPEMWHVVEADAYNNVKDVDLPYERRLRLRLPPNLEVLNLLLSTNDEVVSGGQLRDLIRNHTKTLPHLTDVYVDTGGSQEYYPEYHNRTEQRLFKARIDLAAKSRSLHISTGTSLCASIFDSISESYVQPDLRWFGNKYARRRRRNPAFNQVLHSLNDRYLNMSLEDNEAADSIRRDSQMESMFDRLRKRGTEELQYASEDEE